MNISGHVAKSLERQHLKSVRHCYRAIGDINSELVKLHESIEIETNKNKCHLAAKYVD